MKKLRIAKVVVPVLACFAALSSQSTALEAESTSQAQLSPEDQELLRKWFRPPGEVMPPLPPTLKARVSLDKAGSETLFEACWDAYKTSPRARATEGMLPEPQTIEEGVQITPSKLELEQDGKVMPFFFVRRGQVAEKQPLFIALHGGGSAGGKAPTPHGWEVNSREWVTQLELARSVYPDSALYFVPRMADDNDGRWYYRYCQDAYDLVVRAAVLHHDVDPNRIYLIGISEGAYTAYRLGAFMADRWAGAGSMAGGEPLRNAPPVNMRNLAFRADIGERDTMYDRVGLNRRYAAALEKLRAEDPGGYIHHIEIQSGRGHGIDYTGCLKWLYPHERNPHPKRVRWKAIQVHRRHRNQFYWLAKDDPPDEWPVDIDAVADREAGTIQVSVSRVTDEGKPEAVNDLGLRIYLNDTLMDLDAPIRVTCNDREVFDGIVPRRLEVMMRSLAERGDPSYVFPAEIRIPAL